MADTTKLESNELAEVRMLQEKFQQKVVDLGKLDLQKWQIEDAQKSIVEQEKKLKDEWANLQKMERELMDKLLKKYGEGSLDLVNGTFIPDK